MYARRMSQAYEHVEGEDFGSWFSEDLKLAELFEEIAIVAVFHVQQMEPKDGRNRSTCEHADDVWMRLEHVQ